MPFKRQINFHFFDKWSEDLAYIIGFTMADGCISENRLSYGVNIKDIAILEFIKNKLAPEHSIFIRDEYRNTTLCRCARLRIGSIKLCNMLSNYNIIPQKTGKEKLPDIPIEYRKDFIRGLFDGDGCVNISNKTTTQLTFQICSSNRNFLSEIKSISFDYGYIHRKGPNCWAWYIYKQSDIANIYKYMYDSNGFCLLRKKEKFKEGRICQKRLLQA